MNKVCSKCGIEKIIDDFYKNTSYKDGYYNHCKECIKLKNQNKKYKEYKINYYKENKEKIKEYYDNLSDDRINKLKELKRNYYHNNKEKYSHQKNSEYNELNRKRRREYHKRKIQSDPIYKLKVSFVRRLNKSLRRNKFVNSKSILFKEYIGCDFYFFKSYIESQFEYWMNWDNYGLYNGELNYGWDLDHIIPLSSAKTEDELYKLCHYENLQPLWAEDNLKKSNKIL